MSHTSINRGQSESEPFGAWLTRTTIWKNSAEVAGLLDPPPFADAGKRRAWRTGYESALEDIARGRIPGLQLALAPSRQNNPPEVDRG